MDKIYIIYWSQSGNTQEMAEAIGRGVTSYENFSLPLCDKSLRNGGFL